MASGGIDCQAREIEGDNDCVEKHKGREAKNV